jgi:hypothetical protein
MQDTELLLKSQKARIKAIVDGNYQIAQKHLIVAHKPNMDNNIEGVRNRSWVLGSNIELNSTATSVVTGPMSSSNRHVILQCFMLVFP